MVEIIILQIYRPGSFST